MPKTVDQIRQQIARLQQQEQAILAKEIASVVAKIKIAVNHYGLTPEQIFGGAITPKANVAPIKKASGVKAVASTSAKRSSAAKPEVPPSKRASVAKGTKLVAKYEDGAGNSWTGRGSQPRWLRAAVEAGRKLEDFVIG